VMGDHIFYTERFRSLSKGDKTRVIDSLLAAAGRLASLAAILRNPDLPKPKAVGAARGSGLADESVVSRVTKATQETASGIAGMLIEADCAERRRSFGRHTDCS